ncbi:MAG: hypothetical protein JO322_09345 [Candidatus Eremiobacteraeota bacterium]|nr:hypothetical protein [Candidatus Eremiobacteraeota bacterium]
MEELFLILAVIVAQMTPLPSPAPTPNIPVYVGHPAERMSVNARPLGFDPDGNARWLVVTQFFDAQNKPTRIVANSDFAYLSRDGYVQWQTRLAYGQPSAILSTNADGPLTMTVVANQPHLPSVTVRTNTQSWRAPRLVATALGPHLVQIGWFPRETGEVRIFRAQNGGVQRLLALVAGPSSTFRDTDAKPNRNYRYVVERSGHEPVRLDVTTPAAPRATPIDNVRGKGMWLYFTSNPLDSIYVKNLDARAIVDQAVRSGLHYVELRTSYGAYWEIRPEAKPTVDAIIDGLAAHGIKTIAWAVPRDESFEDLQTAVRGAYYRTANGTPVDGLALDVERGDEFMGAAPQGLSALWHYVEFIRNAMGPSYLIMPTVEDAYLEHLDNQSYPYAQIAQYSTALQPMTYWRMMRRSPTTPQEVDQILQSSYDTLMRDAGRTIPISIGGQTSGVGRNGPPPAQEITTSLDASKRIGALGECFFAWDGTEPYQWDALGSYTWPMAQ